MLSDVVATAPEGSRKGAEVDVGETEEEEEVTDWESDGERD